MGITEGLKSLRQTEEAIKRRKRIAERNKRLRRAIGTMLPFPKRRKIA